jgi:hypothetical protein
MKWRMEDWKIKLDQESISSWCKSYARFTPEQGIKPAKFEKERKRFIKLA